MATTALELYRQVRKEDFPDGVVVEGKAVPGVLFPDFYARELPNGKTRQPDVQMIADDDGAEWVKANGGTSLFDRPGVFKGKSWLSFTLPGGTEIPDSLLVRKTHYNDTFAAWHYQIESSARLMRKDAYQGALDNLARNAVVRALELSKGKTTTL